MGINNFIKILFILSFIVSCGPKAVERTTPGGGSVVQPDSSDANKSDEEEKNKNDDDENEEEQGNVDHSKIVDNCIKCHEKDRKAPNNTGEIHGNGLSCESCHNYSSSIRWKNTRVFNHKPKPNKCSVCHDRPTNTYGRAYPLQGPPSNFDLNNPDELGRGHLVGKDCSSCHESPADGVNAFTWNHSKMNPKICLPCHFNEGKDKHDGNPLMELKGFGNCYNCHKNFDKKIRRNFNIF